ncbi:MAG: L-aspartate oxidase [Oscillospiraceae bacterium]|nr:L-aspartate oxidase [Oscillospiraceae bacterium]
MQGPPTRRYLAGFDPGAVRVRRYDAVILGSGIAGVYTALELPEGARVAIVTKDAAHASSSSLAQGGIAVSLDDGDSPELHFRDSLAAGAGLCDEKSVWTLVNGAAANIESLIRYGVKFDRGEGRGDISLTREGAHSVNRVIHSGDTTGREVCDTLIASAWDREGIDIHERTYAMDIVTDAAGACVGVLAVDIASGEPTLFETGVVVCATGGYGQVYRYTTNPDIATGDGLCMAYRAGAELADLEFVQFHPTVLNHDENDEFLISEAVRGEGGILLNAGGERFMGRYHAMGELAPRDVVSRAIYAEMRQAGAPSVSLDVTHKGRGYLEKRFPNIFRTCLAYGIDISKDLIPVAPAEHYSMGGIRADLAGRTNVPGLYAVGECACTGIHGANRLASNSLLEGLVFGRIIAKGIAEGLGRRPAEPDAAAIIKEGSREGPVGPDGAAEPLSHVKAGTMRMEAKSAMTHGAGIIRSKEGLTQAGLKMGAIWSEVAGAGLEGIEGYELYNSISLSRMVIASALEREESRGAHYRSDFPEQRDEWRRSIVVRRGQPQGRRGV